MTIHCSTLSPTRSLARHPATSLLVLLALAFVPSFAFAENSAPKPAAAEAKAAQTKKTETKASGKPVKLTRTQKAMSAVLVKGSEKLGKWGDKKAAELRPRTDALKKIADKADVGRVNPESRARKSKELTAKGNVILKKSEARAKSPSKISRFVGRVQRRSGKSKLKRAKKFAQIPDSKERKAYKKMNLKATIFEQALTTEALQHTGFEVNLGFRAKTSGNLVTAGPWLMLYTRQAADYIAAKEGKPLPSAVNPGFTVSTPNGALTVNRSAGEWSVGQAFSGVPYFSAYADANRTKMVVGQSGVLLARIGTWKGRGSYMTFGSYIPTGIPRFHFNWNVSLYAPWLGTATKKLQPAFEKAMKTEKALNAKFGKASRWATTPARKLLNTKAGKRLRRGVAARTSKIKAAVSARLKARAAKTSARVR